MNIRILTGVALSITLLTGCSVGQQAAENAAERVLEEQLGPDGSVEVNEDGSIEVESEDGKVSIGTGELPDGWPSDIAAPDGYEIQSAFSAQDGQSMIVVWMAEGERPQDIEALVSSLIASGYTMQTEVPESGLWQLSGSGRTVNIVAGATGGMTTINVSVDDY